MEEQKNVYGQPLKDCSCKPMTGFYRDGKCNTGTEDHGRHVVCVQISKGFLDFSASKGNDLRTPRSEFGFPGLKPNDRWCLCASRWLEALKEGKAPPVFLLSTNIRALEVVRLKDLEAHAVRAKVLSMHRDKSPTLH